jgi:hypothetical protein
VIRVIRPAALPFKSPAAAERLGPTACYERGEAAEAIRLGRSGPWAAALVQRVI